MVFRVGSMVGGVAPSSAMEPDGSAAVESDVAVAANCRHTAARTGSVRHAVQVPAWVMLVFAPLAGRHWQLDESVQRPRLELSSCIS